MIKKQFRSNNGFSVSELVIAMVILASLTAITIATNVSHNKMYTLSKDRLASTMEQTEAFAVIVSYINNASYAKILQDANGDPAICETYDYNDVFLGKFEKYSKGMQWTPPSGNPKYFTGVAASFEKLKPDAGDKANLVKVRFSSPITIDTIVETKLDIKDACASCINTTIGGGGDGVAVAATPSKTWSKKYHRTDARDSLNIFSADYNYSAQNEPDGLLIGATLSNSPPLTFVPLIIKTGLDGSLTDLKAYAPLEANWEFVFNDIKTVFSANKSMSFPYNKSGTNQNGYLMLLNANYEGVWIPGSSVQQPEVLVKLNPNNLNVQWSYKRAAIDPPPGVSFTLPNNGVRSKTAVDAVQTFNAAGAATGYVYTGTADHFHKPVGTTPFWSVESIYAVRVTEGTGANPITRVWGKTYEYTPSTNPPWPGEPQTDAEFARKILTGYVLNTVTGTYSKDGFLVFGNRNILHEDTYSKGVIFIKIKDNGALDVKHVADDLAYVEDVCYSVDASGNIDGYIITGFRIAPAGRQIYAAKYRVSITAGVYSISRVWGRPLGPFSKNFQTCGNDVSISTSFGAIDGYMVSGYCLGDTSGAIDQNYACHYSAKINLNGAFLYQVYHPINQGFALLQYYDTTTNVENGYFGISEYHDYNASYSGWGSLSLCISKTDDIGFCKESEHPQNFNVNLHRYMTDNTKISVS